MAKRCPTWGSGKADFFVGKTVGFQFVMPDGVREREIMYDAGKQGLRIRSTRKPVSGGTVWEVYGTGRLAVEVVKEMTVQAVDRLRQALQKIDPKADLKDNGVGHCRVVLPSVDPKNHFSRTINVERRGRELYSSYGPEFVDERTPVRLGIRYDVKGYRSKSVQVTKRPEQMDRVAQEIVQWYRYEIERMDHRLLEEQREVMGEDVVKQLSQDYPGLKFSTYSVMAEPQTFTLTITGTEQEVRQAANKMSRKK